jgi:intraflagellar transport protein 74
VEEEVRNLEGQLADYNLARDKARTSTDPEEVRHAVFAVREKNLVDEQELDRVFLAKQQRERATK